MNEIKYHFFGKDCLIDRELKNRQNLENSLKKQNFSSDFVLFVNQIHSNQVLVVDEKNKISGEQNLVKADAIITNIKNLTIAIITADCSPILMFDEDKKIIAAIHAGWRGAKNGVISNAVKEMQKLGSNKISAIIGPMIRQDSYQISQDFFAEFIAEDTENKIFFTSSNEEQKYQFDLAAYVKKKLIDCGVSEIKDCGIDTYKNQQDFFSFRRSFHLGEKDCGRNISAIEITS
jgi:hypothetical protein